MAGWSSYGKIDQFILLPVQSLSLAATTFVGQNLGAHQLRRAKHGTGTAILLSLAETAILAIPVMVFAPNFIAMFNSDPDVLSFGTLFIRILSPFYLCLCFNQIYSGSLRGAGDSKAPMFIMLFCFVFFRQLYLYTASQLSGSVVVVALGYPAGWALCSVIMFFYYRFSHWERRWAKGSGAAEEEPAEVTS